MLKEIEEAQKNIKEYKHKNEKLQAQNQKLKETIKKQELECKILKRKQWVRYTINMNLNIVNKLTYLLLFQCYWCLEEAIYLCCFRAAYCSEVCQSRHWKDGHSKVCKNPSNGSNTKS